MTRKQALQDLLDKVEAGEASSGKEIVAVFGKFGPPEEGNSWHAWKAFHGSLDAARALHDAVLPRWTYCDHLRRGLRYTVYLAKTIEDETVDAVTNDHARAWLIAILKALISEEGE